MDRFWRERERNGLKSCGSDFLFPHLTMQRKQVVLSLDFSQLRIYEKIPTPSSNEQQQQQLRLIAGSVDSWKIVLENILNEEGQYIMRIHPHASLEKRERQKYFETIKIPDFLILPLLMYCCLVRDNVNRRFAIPNLLVHSGRNFFKSDNSF